MSHFSAVLGRPNALDGNYAPATLKAFRATAKRYAYSTSQGLDTRSLPHPKGAPFHRIAQYNLSGPNDSP